MKRYFFLIFLMISCSSHNIKENKIIPYIFPAHVDQAISGYSREKGEVSYFYLATYQNDWILYLVQCDSCKNKYNVIKNTNRKVLFHQKFYPLILLTDEAFAVGETVKELKNDNFNSYTHIDFNHHQSYQIIFDATKIKYKGY